MEGRGMRLLGLTLCVLAFLPVAAADKKEKPGAVVGATEVKAEAKGKDAKAGAKPDAKDTKAGAKADAKDAKAEAKTLTPEEQAAADAKAAKERAALLLSKPKMYKKFNEAKRAAKLLNQPVLMILVEKGSKGAELYKKTLIQNQLFMKDFAKKNFIVYYAEFKKNVKTKEYDMKRIGKEEKALIESFFTQDVKLPYLAVVKPDMSESVFQVGSFIPELPQIKADLPMQTFMQALVPLMEAKNFKMDVSEKMKKFMESQPKEKGAKKEKK